MTLQHEVITGVSVRNESAAPARTPAKLQLPASDQRRIAAADNHGKRVGVLIVAYNAITTLSSVLNRIPPEVWKNVEEVAVFDDASPDETHVVGVGYKAVTGIEKLTVLRNEKNLGYGGNQKLGYSYFLNKGFDVVVLLHGDGQYAPEILADMYAPIVNGEADAVFGSRMMKEFGGARKGGMPLYKFVGNKILTFAENKALGMSLTEFHSGYRAYSLEALKKIVMSKMTDDFHFDTEIIIKLHHQGFRIKEVPIPTYYGDEICYVNGMKYARDVFKALVRYKKTVRAVNVYPEFAEYAPHYPLKKSRFSSHDYFMRLCGANHDILDVGCGEGFFAAEIAKENNRVTGVDILPHPQCASAFVQYVSADLDTGLDGALPALEGKTFDRVLLQDVLEHLRFGDKILHQCRPLLKENGRLLVSVPNVANITIRLMLLLGRFDYTQRGILDKTHLRFYTRKTARRFLQNAGYEITMERSSVMPVELALGLSADNPFIKLMNVILAAFTAILPGLFGYQCIFAARPAEKGK